jgi:hypothetical protein
LAVLVTPWVIGGCGSSSSSDAAATTESSKPLTKAEFSKQATEICEHGVDQKDKEVASATKKMISQTQGSPTFKDAQKIVEEAIIPVYAKIIDQLGQLNAPAGEGGQAGKIVKEFEATLKTVEANPAGAVRKNPFAPADEAAIAYGIEACRL